MTPFLIIFGLIIFLSFAVAVGEVDRTIKLDDINVGDRLKIKGEKFTVKGYSDNGLMELEKSPGVVFIIKFDEGTKFIEINSSGARQYIEVKNFKGTVGGDYLKKIKME